MKGPIKVVLKNNWAASASIAAGIIGMLNYGIYIFGNLQFLSIYLISLYSFATGIFIGIIGIIVGIIDNEGKVLAIAGTALSAFLFSRLLLLL